MNPLTLEKEIISDLVDPAMAEPEPPGWFPISLPPMCGTHTLRPGMGPKPAGDPVPRTW